MEPQVHQGSPRALIIHIKSSLLLMFEANGLLCLIKWEAEWLELLISLINSAKSRGQSLGGFPSMNISIIMSTNST
jgi:hypothetical protein